ncbi:MAG: ParB/RepB/Spo0J family partition protein [Candidatus Sedimenticola sp. (ex Thyasira tokunagai)]
MAKKSTSMLNKIPTRNFDFAKKDLMRVSMFSLADITPDPNQPRKHFEKEALQELADSIEAQGLIQPIVLRSNPDGGYIIVAGERRYRAYKLLEREQIEGIITKGDPEEIALIENVQRENLTPVEEAFAYKRLMENRGVTQTDLAAIVGKRQNTVSEIMAITNLPDTILNKLEKYPHVSKSQLIIIAKERDAAQQEALWASAKQGRFTVRDARADRAGEKRESTLTPGEKALKSTEGAIKRLEGLDTIEADELAALKQLRGRLNAVLKAHTN